MLVITLEYHQKVDFTNSIDKVKDVYVQSTQTDIFQVFPSLSQ